jgi:GTPase SAR1 family protein
MQQVAVLEGHTMGVTSVVFDPSGMFISSGALDNSIRLWDLTLQRQEVGCPVSCDDLYGLAMNYRWALFNVAEVPGYDELVLTKMIDMLKITHHDSLNFDAFFMGDQGVHFVSTVIMHSTALTSLSLQRNELSSAGLAVVLSSLTNLTSLTKLDVSLNNCDDDDWSLVFKTLSSSWMPRLSDLRVGPTRPHLIVKSAAWHMLKLPVPPDEVLAKVAYSDSNYILLLKYIMSENKIISNAMRIFVIGDAESGKTSLIQALKSDSSKCPAISLDNRTVGIDTHSFLLHPLVCDSDMTVSDDHSLTDSSSTTPRLELQIWDFAGQDAYMLSHSVFFSHRCLYLLLWKPSESVDSIMQRLSPWLESLSMVVPDAHVVLVASHCKTVTDVKFSSLSEGIQQAVLSKVKELNELTKLEASKLGDLWKQAQEERLKMQSDYANLQMDRNLQSSGPVTLDLVSAHAADYTFPRSFRVLAAKLCKAFRRERIIFERLQLMLGIRDDALPDKRDPCKMTLHCRNVDSVEGFGIAELRSWLYDYCRSLPFMNHMISSGWIDIVDIFKKESVDAVLSKTDAIELVKRHLVPLRGSSMSDDDIWHVLEFWSSVGRIFIYESLVVREPSTLIALLKPLLHHEPLQMLTNDAYRNLLDEYSLSNSQNYDLIASLLRRLQTSDLLDLTLLNYFSAWKSISSDLRNSVLMFLERSRLLCRVDQNDHSLLISSRFRSKPHFTEEVDAFTARSSYHALYLLHINHIALISNLQSRVASFKLHGIQFVCHSGRDSLIVRSINDPQRGIAFSIEEFDKCVQCYQRFNILSHIMEPFSYVLRAVSSDFGMFKFAVSCIDSAMDSEAFGSRYQCWVLVTPSTPGDSSSSTIWTQFRDSSHLNEDDRHQKHDKMLRRKNLSVALQCNHHEQVSPEQTIMSLFNPRSYIFVSHAWGDGTGEFIQRLKTHLEQQTLASVWVDTDGLNQQQEKLITAFRYALCQSRVVFVVLTPTYLTRPNCLRELRWALDLEQAGHVSVVLMSLHPAVTFRERQKLVQDGPLQGLVFCSKEHKVKRLCNEAMALVKRLNDVDMNMLPWHELQAWRSDGAKSDWEEHRQYTQRGTDKTLCLAGGPDGLVEQTVIVVKKWLVWAEPRPVVDCCKMDDTQALTASDITDTNLVCSALDLTIYPEEAAATLKKETAATMQLEVVSRKEVQASGVFPSFFPPGLPRLSAQDVASRVKSIAPAYDQFYQIFVDHGFDGEVVSSYAGKNHSELLHDLGNLGIKTNVQRFKILSELGNLFNPQTYETLTSASIELITTTARDPFFTLRCSAAPYFSLLYHCGSHTLSSQKVHPVDHGDGQGSDRNKGCCSLL